MLSVIIPVYNEESTLGELLTHVASVPIEKEIIVVDDGSTDRTPEIIRAHASDVKHVHASTHNLGKGSAIRIGLSYVSGDIVIIQDADLELNPSEYLRLMEPITAGRTNVVYGSRFHQGNQIPVLTRAANRLLTMVTNRLYGSSLTDMETAYKVFRTTVIGRIHLQARGFEIEPEITAKLLRSGEHIHEIPIAYRPRSRNEGKKIHWRDGVVALWTLLRWRVVASRHFIDRPAGM